MSHSNHLPARESEKMAVWGLGKNDCIDFIDDILYSSGKTNKMMDLGDHFMQVIECTMLHQKIWEKNQRLLIIFEKEGLYTNAI